MKTAIIAGAGIVGLAMARSLAIRGYRVTVLEREHQAIGASIRNFGMVWPIGQPDGPLYERALQSLHIWKQCMDAMRKWYGPFGSLHAAYLPMEQTVMQEVATVYAHRQYRYLSADEALQISPALQPKGLLGALYSPHETIIDPREAIANLPALLHEKYGVTFHFGKMVNEVHPPYVVCGNERWMADLICICNGADFETLYPHLFAAQPLTKCKLQMMRLAPQPGGWKMGPALCAGLSLIHYKSFAEAPSLPSLRSHYEETLPEYIRWGIHVMVSQNGAGELTVGDTHEYGQTFAPFDRADLNNLVLSYLKRFAQFQNWQIIETWHGIYSKMTDGSSEWVHEAEPGVWLVNGLGGAGMTLSFGLAEKIAESLA